MKPLTHQIAATLLAALATAACSATAVPVAETVPQTTVETAGLEALYRARMDSARMRFTDADVHFMTGMIGHHAQALVMAGLAPTHGASPAVQTLCARIMSNGLSAARIASVRQELADAERASGNTRRVTLTNLAAALNGEADSSRGSSHELCVKVFEQAPRHVHHAA